MKLKYILLSSLMLLSGCKDPKYGDLYIKDNINLYLRDDKTFYLEKDNKKFKGTYNMFFSKYCGDNGNYDSEYLLSFEKEKIYNYVSDFSFLHLTDINYEGFFEDLELSLDSVINKDIEIEVKEDFDIMYKLETSLVPKNTHITLRLRLYSRNENECKELFNYYINKIINNIFND